MVAMSSGRGVSFGYSCRFVIGGGCCAGAAAGGVVCALTADTARVTMPNATTDDTNRLMIAPRAVLHGVNVCRDVGSGSSS